MFSSVNVQNEYEKNPQLNKKDVKILMDWVQKQPHLPEITELQAILFLHSCFFNVEKARITVDTYFTFRAVCSDIFSRRSPTEKCVQSALNVSVIAPMKNRTPEGYLVAYCRLLDYNPDKFNFVDQIRLLDMQTSVVFNKYGTVNGFIAIIDMEGIVFGHLLKVNILTMKKFMIYLQEAIPVRIKGIHFINLFPFMDKLLALMKPFMKKELIDILHLHPNSLESLYKFVPQECLPHEYGGQEATLSELQDRCKQTIEENAELFRFEAQQVVDESKRPAKTKKADLCKMEGSFKKLEID